MALFRFSGLNERRWQLFKQNKRGYWSLWIFGVLFVLSLFAEFIANERPLVLEYKNELYFPVVKDYPETEFGGFFETPTDYRDPYVQNLIKETGGWIVWPLIPYSENTINRNIPVPAPAPPSWDNPLGTDDQARDVAARVIYGFRISVLFGLLLTVFSSIIGVWAGAMQGYFGGKVDLAGQRFIEIWGGLPELFMLIILASIVTPNFWWLLGIMVLFRWTSLVDVVRAEVLRARNFD